MKEVIKPPIGGIAMKRIDSTPEPIQEWKDMCHRTYEEDLLFNSDKIKSE